MVCRFVEQQNVRVLHQQSSQRNASAFSSRDFVQRLIGRRTAQGFHRHLDLIVNRPRIECVQFLLDFRLLFHQLVHRLAGHFFAKLRVDLIKLRKQVIDPLRTFAHDFQHSALLVCEWLLLKKARRESLGPFDLAIEFFIHSGHDAKERGLSAAIQSKHADLGAVVIRKRNVLENFFAVDRLGDVQH